MDAEGLEIIATAEADGYQQADNRPDTHYPEVDPLEPQTLLKWVEGGLNGY